MDNVSKEKRSYIMSRIRGKDTGPERRMQMLLVRNGTRFTRWNPLPGKPDFVVNGIVAVFVDGCYWHGCPKHKSRPKTNQSFWMNKFKMNRRRDLRVNKALLADGYIVLRFWEHELKKGAVSERILGLLKGHRAIQTARKAPKLQKSAVLVTE